MSGRNRAASLALAAMVAVSCGCAVPLPRKCEGRPAEGSGPRCVDRERASFIAPGKTTKDDVIRELGPPSRLFRSGSVYGYDRELGGWVVVFPGLGGALGFGLPLHHLLLVEFDAENRVVRHAWKDGYGVPGPDFPDDGKTGSGEAPTGAGGPETMGAPRESK